MKRELPVTAKVEAIRRIILELKPSVLELEMTPL